MDRDARNEHARVARIRGPLGGSTMSVQRERTVILTLLVLVAASWAILIWQSRTAQGMGGGLTMGMGAALFLTLWVVMMAAMMVPSALPVILAVARVQPDTGSERAAFVPTWVF